MTLSSCAPLGYMQSPRVKGSINVGPSGHVEIPLQIDTVTGSWIESKADYYDNEMHYYTRKESNYTDRDIFYGVSALCPHFEFKDRFRVALYPILTIMPFGGGRTGVMSEVMFAIKETGEPRFFQNIAIGLMMSQYAIFHQVHGFK